MPEEGEPLTDAEAELLAKWIDAGADWPDGLVLREASKADKSWWAYQKLARPKHNSIDAYIDERLSAAGLKKNPAATRRNLIRRATYDLTGLPPSLKPITLAKANNIQPMPAPAFAIAGRRQQSIDECFLWFAEVPHGVKAFMVSWTSGVSVTLSVRAV